MLGETAVAFPKISVSMSSGGTHREFASFSWGVVPYVLKVDIRTTRLKEHGLKYQEINFKKLQGFTQLVRVLSE